MNSRKNALRMAAAALCVLFAVALINGCNEESAPVATPETTDHATNMNFNVVPEGYTPQLTPLGKTLNGCPEDRYCGPMDVVFCIDITGSMYDAIENVKGGINGILDCIDVVSGNDYQLGLITFDDALNIQETFSANNKSSIASKINALSAGGGWEEPEASDQAIHYAVSTWTGWRPAAKKVIVLVTDARPGGFDDTYTVGVDDVNAMEYAQDAMLANIGISAIFTETNTTYSTTIAYIMDMYATTTGGYYEMIPTADNGAGTGAAILNIMSTCGFYTLPIYIDIHPGSCPNPINVASNGIVPVAILGEAGLDVMDIDLSTLELNGVPPMTWSATGDVGMPFYGPLLDCYSCNTYGPDGYTDLKLKFKTQDLAVALEAYSDGECVILYLTGSLNDGTPFQGKDIVKIIK